MSEQAAPVPAPAAEAPAAPAAPMVNKEELIVGFLRRIEAGEFDQPEDAFHRFVVKEIYPLLGARTITGKDLERITQKYSGHADPYNKGYETHEAALK